MVEILRRADIISRKGKWTGLLLLALMAMFQSCKESGCADPNADNYNANAQPEGCSCSYLPGTISFCTNTEKGGAINVELKKVECYDGGSMGSGTFNFHPIEEDACIGGEGQLTFTRFVPQAYNYRATDQAGNEWEGSVDLIPEACQKVMLTREAFSETQVVFYSSQPLNSTWTLRVDDDYVVEINSSDYDVDPVPCDTRSPLDPGKSLRLTQGKHILELHTSPGTVVSREVTILGDPCTYFDLSQLIP
ncbi:hypothetical protein KFE98_01825 [bacterium SCSIO 12741]|nr:hypothetical protein KFE98_01825 [bacterium SCSIO 12741]